MNKGSKDQPPQGASARFSSRLPESCGLVAGLLITGCQTTSRSAPATHVSTASPTVTQPQIITARPRKTCRSFASPDELCAAWLQALVQQQNLESPAPDYSCDHSVHHVDGVTEQVQTFEARIERQCGSGKDRLAPSGGMECSTINDVLKLMAVGADRLWPIALARTFDASNGPRLESTVAISASRAGDLELLIRRTVHDGHHEGLPGNLKGSMDLVLVGASARGPVERVRIEIGPIFHGLERIDDCSSDDPAVCYQFVHREPGWRVERVHPDQLIVYSPSGDEDGTSAAAITYELPPTESLDPLCAEEFWTDLGDTLFQSLW